MTGATSTLPRRCSLYQALLWVVEQIPPIEDLIFDSLPPPSWVVIEDKHKRELLVALKLGTLRAQGDLWDLRGPRFRLENECADISPQYWEWNRVDWEASSLTVVRDRKANGEFTEVSVPTIDLLKAFPSDARPLVLEVPSKEGRRGRPPKFNWPAFYAEVAVRADLDGLPGVQAELERAMAQWCSVTWGEEPGEAALRQALSLIYRHPRKARK
jgi:hypothetical protein